MTYCDLCGACGMYRAGICPRCHGTGRLDVKPIRIEPKTTPGTCRSCGARIEWAITASGARLPLNPPVVTMPSLIPGAFVDIDTSQTRSHFATCPQADKWKRKVR